MAAIAAAPRSLARAAFSMAGRVLAVAAQDESFTHILETTYADARVSDGRGVHHTAAVRRLGDGRLHVRFDRRALPIGDLGTSCALLSAYYAAKELFARFAVAHPESIALYGALVEIGGSAVLILGPTSIGKTLFALHLAWQGARFLGDETVVLELRPKTVCALARKPALREPALAFLPSDEMRASITAGDHVLETERGKMWYALRADQLGGIAPSDRAHRLGAVCIIRDRCADFTMRRIELSQSLPALMQRAYVRPSQLAQVSGLRRAMRGVPQFEISLADPQRSAGEFLREVQTCA